MVRCDQINGSTNQRSDENGRSVSTNTLGIMGIKTFSFVGGTQYHDGDDFSCVAPQRLALGNSEVYFGIDINKNGGNNVRRTRSEENFV